MPLLTPPPRPHALPSEATAAGCWSRPDPTVTSMGPSLHTTVTWAPCFSGSSPWTRKEVAVAMEAALEVRMEATPDPSLHTTVTWAPSSGGSCPWTRKEAAVAAMEAALEARMEAIPEGAIGVGRREWRRRHGHEGEAGGVGAAARGAGGGGAAGRRGLLVTEATSLVDTCMDLTRDANFYVVQGGLQVLSAAAMLASEHFKIQLNALVPASVERLGDGKQPVRDAARQLLITLMENLPVPTLPAPPVNGSKLPGLSRKLLFQKAPESRKKALTEVKNSNTWMLAMVLRSKRELLAQSKEQEDEIADFVPPDIEAVGHRVFLAHKQYFVSSDVGAGKMQWYAFHKEHAGGTDVENGKKKRLLEIFGG